MSDSKADPVDGAPFGADGDGDVGGGKGMGMLQKKKLQLVRSIRGLVSKKKRRFKEAEFDLDLTYITPRIIAMGFPSSGTEGIYRNPLPEVQRFFNKYHAGKYMIYNLCSERAYDPVEFEGRAQRFPFDDHNPCPLSMIGEFCASVDQWLAKDKDNVVAIHCKAGKGRTGLMISAYLLHSNFRPTAERALSYFGDARTANAQGVTIPSQMRYVHYYEHILKYGPSEPLRYRITHIRVITVPKADIVGSCAPYFTVVEDGKQVFDYSRAVGKVPRFRKDDLYLDIDVSGLNCVVRGNVKLTFYHEKMPAATKLFHLWFHTAYIADNYLAFTKSCIDKACKDKSNRFAPNFGIEIYMEQLGDEDDDATDDDDDDERSSGSGAGGGAAAAVGLRVDVGASSDSPTIASVGGAVPLTFSPVEVDSGTVAAGGGDAAAGGGDTAPPPPEAST